MNWTHPEFLYKKIIKFQTEYPDFFFTSLDTFCRNQNWNLIPYHNFEKEICEISEDGFCYIDDGEYNIFYNKDKPPTRQRFTISHEIGHIYLNHHATVKPRLLKYSSKYTGIWEQQANIFAHNVLLPIEYIDNIKHHGIDEISKTFGLSKAMVKVRLAKLEQDKKWFKAIKNFYV